MISPLVVYNASEVQKLLQDQANAVAATFEIYIILLVVVAICMIAILAIYIYGLGPFRYFVFFKGALLADVNPDNTLNFRKARRLRKAMFIFKRGKTEVPYRSGLLTGYSTNGGPRIYLRYAPSEMSVQIRLLPWIKKMEERMKKRWKYSPQSWEQLCVLFYKDYIDRKLNDFEDPSPRTEIQVLNDDKVLIEEMETGKLRPYLDEEGKQMTDTTGKPLFHAPHNIDEREQLLDRAELAMLSDNPKDFSLEQGDGTSVDIKDAVMFRRSTFTDNDLTDAYQEGYLKAQDTSHRDTTRIAVIAISIFIVMVGAAVLLSSAHII